MKFKYGEDVYSIGVGDSGFTILYKGSFMGELSNSNGKCKVHWFYPPNSIYHGSTTVENMCNLARTPTGAINKYLKSIKTKLIEQIIRMESKND